ncbi:MAG TPA: sigma-70 family RNA polymerase sigma factor [Mucilaginibacter sp.]|jgi:RNA polymerase sigma factor (sigma-70 family)
MRKGKDLKEEWVAFIQTESEQAFHELYTHYFHYLNYVGLKKGFPANRVKDSINDLFLYLWENRNKLRHTLDHHNYILTAFLRKLYRKENFGADNSSEFYSLPDFGFSPSAETLHIHRASTTDVGRILRGFIEQLPQRQRSMIYQKFYLGLSYKEIANANGVSINTVYNTIYKAVDKFRALIGKEQLGAMSLSIALLTELFFIFFQKQ